jgi:Rod binding domain-containing protein
MSILNVGQQQRETLVGQPANVPQPRLVKAAHEFEAAMMKEILKPLESGQEDEAQGSGAALTSFAGEALGKALSERGGFGIARSVIQQLSNGSNQNRKSHVPNVQMQKLVISQSK